jgi:hypothetical protein
MPEICPGQIYEPDPTAPERICRCHNREGLEPGQHENDCPLILARKRSDVQIALDALEDLDLDLLSAEDIDALDAWANNIQLDIMRHRRNREARRDR